MDVTIRETDVYKKWFAKLKDTVAKARILVRLRRMSLGNFGEFRNGELVILLAGGISRRKQKTLLGQRSWLRICEEAEMKTKTTIWKAENHLKTKEEREAYLNAAFEDGDASVIAAALGDIARAEGMSKVAKKTGLGRESLYKTLSADGNPALSTILKILKAFDFNLRAACL